MRGIQIASTLCIAAMLAVCAACGSSSSSSSATTEVSSATSTPATTTATSSSGGSVSDTAFCGEAKATAQNLEKIDSQIAAVGTPTAFKTLLNNDQSAYTKLVSNAPSDISTDAQTLEASFNKVIAFFAKYHYDVQQAAPHIAALNGVINSAKVKAAEAHLKAWGNSNCS